VRSSTSHHADSLVLVSIFLQPDQTVDPTLLSHQEVVSFLDVASFSKALLRPQINTASISAPRQFHLPIVATSTQSVEAGSVIEGAHAADILGCSQDLLSPPLHDDTPGEDLGLDLLTDYSSPGNMRSTDLGQDGLERSSNDAGNDSQARCGSLAKRKVAPMLSAVRKRKVSNGNDSQTQDDMLIAYLSEEAGRCENHGCPPPQESFFTPAVREAIRDICEAEADTLARISVYIASPHSIAELQEILQKLRDQQILPTIHLGVQLSKAKRFNLIRKLDKHITYFQLLRRYHVLELFKECGGPVTPLGSGFILTTQGNFGKTRNKPGNPTNSAEAEVTTKMMEEICPDIGSDSDEYQAMYRIATDLRKLGQRLYILEKTFAGRGILGLMLTPSFTGQLGIGISDNM
jgi:hypothetical protein